VGGGGGRIGRSTSVTGGGDERCEGLIDETGSAEDAGRHCFTSCLVEGDLLKVHAREAPPFEGMREGLLLLLPTPMLPAGAYGREGPTVEDGRGATAIG